MTVLTSDKCYQTAKAQNQDKKRSKNFDMSKVACIILGGGQGTRLFPLTQSRCKPAICFGGRYRLIDIPISNSIHSNIHKIFIVTQFLSTSLHRHILQTYRLGTFSKGFIEILTAEQRPESSSWFQGTADAIRKSIEYLAKTPVEYFLILSGDQLYQLDYRQMVLSAVEKDVDVIVASLPVGEREAKRMGIMKLNEDHHIVDFHEKPHQKAIMERFKISSPILHSLGLAEETERRWLGSMGIYLFKRDALFQLLKEDSREDFGKHLIPTKVKSGQIAAFLHNGYWEDIGTVESFYHANIELTKPCPEFDIYSETNPLFTYHYNLPGPKISHTQLQESILCEGAIIEAEQISRSVIGPRSIIKRGSTIKDSYIMGNDFYYPPVRSNDQFPKNLYIGENTLIQKAIIDKNVSIGNRVELVNKSNLKHYNGENVYIRDGIIIVPQGATIPDNFVL